MSATDLLPIPVSVQTIGRNALEGEGIKTVGKVRIMSKYQLMRIKHFGQKSLDELREALLALEVEVHESWHPAARTREPKTREPKTRIK